MTELDRLELILRRVAARQESEVSHNRALLMIIIEEIAKYTAAHRETKQ